MKLILLLAWLSGAAWAYPLTPNVQRTPGSKCTTQDRDFFELRYKENIPYCRRAVYLAEQELVYKEYRIPEKDRPHYTIDHLVPLALGGSNHKDNLWPEHKEVKALRYNLENELYLKMRDGRLTQKQAIDTILQAKFHPREFHGTGEKEKAGE